MRHRVVFATEPWSDYGRPSLARLLSFPDVELVALLVSGPLPPGGPVAPLLRLWRRASPWRIGDPRSGRPPVPSLLPSPRALAERLGIPLLSSRPRRSLASSLAALRPDLLVSAGHETILPEDALDVPAQGAWNLHPTLLPEGAGPAPWFWTLLRNGPFGVTLHRMTREADAGPVLLQRRLEAPPRPSYAWMATASALLAAELLAEGLPMMTALNPPMQPAQPPRRDPLPSPGDLTIDWNASPEEIDRRVRACGREGAIFGPRYPGVRILEGRPDPGSYRILRVRDERGRELPAEEWRRTP